MKQSDLPREHLGLEPADVWCCMLSGHRGEGRGGGNPAKCFEGLEFGSQTPPAEKHSTCPPCIQCHVAGVPQAVGLHVCRGVWGSCMVNRLGRIFQVEQNKSNKQTYIGKGGIRRGGGGGVLTSLQHGKQESKALIHQRVQRHVAGQVHHGGREQGGPQVDCQAGLGNPAQLPQGDDHPHAAAQPEAAALAAVTCNGRSLF